jgi:predicted nucleic acid-binding protein
MPLLDVNVLIGAHRLGSSRHKEYARFVESLATSAGTYSIPSIVRSGFLRIVTNRRIFPVPTPLDKALEFLDEAKGNDIPDAYLAALALEKGTELITADRGFARFPGLRWTHPLDGKD